MSRIVMALTALGLLGACGGGDAAADREASAPARVVVQDRYVVRESALGFEATLSALYEALDRRDLTIFAVIDHAAAAEGAGAMLAPTTVVIFGNPKAGTPLMAEVPVMGAELPLRALVYERGGEVFVAVTGVSNLARTYPLSEQAKILNKVERLLAEIGNEVTAP